MKNIIYDNLESLITSKIYGMNKNIRWLPIFKSKEKVLIGVTEKEEWIINTKYKTIFLDTRKSYIYILPILEEKLEQIIYIIEDSFQSYGIMVNGFEIFPFSDFIMQIFKYEEVSNYWIELAFEWFKSFPGSYRKRFIITLKKLSQNKKYTQKFRHTIMKELTKVMV